jgi:hypothetical protein
MIGYIGYDSEYDLGGMNRIFDSSESIVRNGLVLYIDPAKNIFSKWSLFYRWFLTDGTNPTNATDFNAFFAQQPAGQGVHSPATIDWLDLASRPSYISATISFAWEVSGVLVIDEPGEYIFNIRSDDGNQLEIDGNVVTSFYGGRGVPNPGDVSSPISLSNGYHTFRYRMQQGAGGAGAQVRWQKPGGSSYEVIPFTNFGYFETSTLLDLSQNSNNASSLGGVTFSLKNKGIISVSDGSYIFCPTVPGTGTSSSSVSWSVWTKPFVSDGNIMSMSALNPQGGWNMPPITAVNQTFTGKIWSNSRLSSSTFLINSWYNLVLVWDAENSTQRFYVNNQLQGEQTGISYSSSGVDNNLFFGQANPGADNAGNYAGSYGPIKVYSKALSNQEIQQNFNALRGRYGI